MKLLIIAFNCNHDNFQKYDHDQTLYLFSLPIKKIQKCHHYIFIDENNLEKEIIHKVYPYKDYYDCILLLDNSSEVKIINDELYEFGDFSFNENDFLAGNIIPSRFDIQKNMLIGSRYQLNQLFISCKELKNDHKDDLSSQVNDNVFFPFFSILTIFM